MNTDFDIINLLTTNFIFSQLLEVFSISKFRELVLGLPWSENKSGDPLLSGNSDTTVVS